MSVCFNGLNVGDWVWVRGWVYKARIEGSVDRVVDREYRVVAEDGTRATVNAADVNRTSPPRPSLCSAV